MIAPIAALAEKVRTNRHPVATGSPWRIAESRLSKQITGALDSWRHWRDHAVEQFFLQIYGQPLLQTLVGLGTSHPPRRRPGAEPEHRRFVERRQAELHARIAEGAPMRR